MRWPAVLAATMLVAACAGKHTARPEWLDLNGSWRYNEQASDRPMLGEAGERPAIGQRPGGGSMPPGGMPPGGMPGGRGGRGGRGEMGERSGRFSPDMMQGLREFRLTQTDSTIRFHFGGKSGVVVPTNGKKVKTEMWPGAPVMQDMPMGMGGGGAPETELKAQWTADGLQLERSYGRASVKELWSRAPQSKRLIITTKVGERELRRVYDLVEPGQK